MSIHIFPHFENICEKMNLEMRFTLNFPISKTTFRPSFAFVMTRCLKINLKETSKRYNSFPTNILILTDLLLLFQLQQPCLRLTVCEKFSACPWQLDPWLVIPAPTHPWEHKTIRNLNASSSHSKCVTPLANGKRKSRVQWSTHRRTGRKNMKGETLLYVCEWQGEPKYTYLPLKTICV